MTDIQGVKQKSNLPGKSLSTLASLLISYVSRLVLICLSMSFEWKGLEILFFSSEVWAFCCSLKIGGIPFVLFKFGGRFSEYVDWERSTAGILWGAQQYIWQKLSSKAWFTAWHSLGLPIMRECCCFGLVSCDILFISKKNVNQTLPITIIR